MTDIITRDITADPVPGNELDKELAAVIRGFRLARIPMIGAFVLAIASLIFAAVLFARQADTVQHDVNHAVVAECGFFRDLGGVPPAPMSSELGVKIVVDSRNAFTGLLCPGKLSPPSALLIALVKKYHLTLEG